MSEMVNIQGTVIDIFGNVPNKYDKIIFRMEWPDFDDNSVVLSGPFETNIRSDGTFSFEVWSNTSGYRDSYYVVSFTGLNVATVNLGKVKVPASSRPINLTDLLVSAGRPNFSRGPFLSVENIQTHWIPDDQVTIDLILETDGIILTLLRSTDSTQTILTESADGSRWYVFASSVNTETERMVVEAMQARNSAMDWAQSEDAPDPQNTDTKSSKSWALISQGYSFVAAQHLTTIERLMKKLPPRTFYDDFVVEDGQEYFINANNVRDTTVSLPTPSTLIEGRVLNFKNLVSRRLVSNITNVSPLTGGVLTTEILPATLGAWVELVCDGDYWVVMKSS